MSPQCIVHKTADGARVSFPSKGLHDKVPIHPLQAAIVYVLAVCLDSNSPERDSLGCKRDGHRSVAHPSQPSR